MRTRILSVVPALLAVVPVAGAEGVTVVHEPAAIVLYRSAVEFRLLPSGEVNR